MKIVRRKEKVAAAKKAIADRAAEETATKELIVNVEGQKAKLTETASIADAATDEYFAFLDAPRGERPEAEYNSEREARKKRMSEAAEMRRKVTGEYITGIDAMLAKFRK